MNVYEAVIKRRTIRRFKQQPVSFRILEKIVNSGRLAPSGSNLQPVEFMVVDIPELVVKVFETLAWAGYISPAGNPPEGQRPVAYIIVLTNKNKYEGDCVRDVAAAIENMILVALEEGIGSCWLGSINTNKLRNILKLPEHINIDSVVALGYSDESPQVEEMKDSVEYWKDENGVLHVPKRSLGDVFFYNEYPLK